MTFPTLSYLNEKGELSSACKIKVSNEILVKETY